VGRDSANDRTGKKVRRMGCGECPYGTYLRWIQKHKNLGRAMEESRGILKRQKVTVS